MPRPPHRKGDRVDTYDLCVIGSGPAGQKAAIQAAKLGRRVIVVERRETVGGVAINTGTIPSKALREAILNLAGRRTAAPTTEDFHAARKHTFVGLQHATAAVIGHEVDIVQSQLMRNGVEIVHGHARFTGSKSVRVEGVRGIIDIEADNFLIAVGTKPAKPDSYDFDGSNIVTSDELFQLSYLPHTMLVVGGGVIGTEYASMMAALGVRVTLIEGRDRLLDFLDGEIVEALQYHLRQAGVTLRLGEKVVKIDKVEPPRGARSVNDCIAQATLESGKTLRADCLLYAIGRQGATADMGLENAHLTPDKRGRIEVNSVLKTTADGIYAAGDVIGFPALASTSMEQGRIAACEMFDHPHDPQEELLPYGIYSIPEISMVGWTERKLTDEGIPFESGVANYREIARGKLLGDEHGMLKMLVHQESRVILGVHAIGSGATELIHIGQCAIAFKATVDYFVDAVFNYPTLAECYKVAAFNAVNKIEGV
ncbi:MAG: Si-specific NAD(P)(+) transhydrogenase [Planctomycetota bacterium]